VSEVAPEDADPLQRELVAGIADAADRIAASWRGTDELLLRIDGFMGAGKSSNAALLAKSDESIRVINPDNFASRDLAATRFAEKVDIDRLHSVACRAISEGNRVIFEGVCLEELLPSSQFGRGFCVYIKRVSLPAPGLPLWHDGFNLEAIEPAHDWLHEDIIRYHRECQPHECADLILAVPEGRE
jgi:hypothetical protein